jgi:uncharacterized peroxidase-related enzyme
MSRFQTLNPNTATGKSKDLLTAVHNKLGRDLNMAGVMANSAAVLEGYLNFSGALSSGQLSVKLREQIALITAQENHCDYCLSAHSAIGKMVGLNHDKVIASREAKGQHDKTTAALIFAKRVLDTKGQVTESDLNTARAAGFSDGEVAEIIAHVALNVFTNYFNTATKVDIDFPAVSHSEVA